MLWSRSRSVGACADRAALDHLRRDRIERQCELVHKGGRASPPGAGRYQPLRGRRRARAECAAILTCPRWQHAAAVFTFAAALLTSSSGDAEAVGNVLEDRLGNGFERWTPCRRGGAARRRPSRRDRVLAVDQHQSIPRVRGTIRSSGSACGGSDLAATTDRGSGPGWRGVDRDFLRERFAPNRVQCSVS